MLGSIDSIERAEQDLLFPKSDEPATVPPHRHVVRVLGFCVDFPVPAGATKQRALALMMPFYSGGTLSAGVEWHRRLYFELSSISIVRAHLWMSVADGIFFLLVGWLCCLRTATRRPSDK